MWLVTNERDFMDHPLTVSDLLRQIQVRSSCIVLYASLMRTWHKAEYISTFLRLDMAE